MSKSRAGSEREKGAKTRGGEENKNGRNQERRLEADRDGKSVHDMGKWQRGIFRAALEHKRVIVLAQMLLSHNKQDTMFLLS